MPYKDLMYGGTLPNKSTLCHHGGKNRLPLSAGYDVDVDGKTIINHG